MKKKDKEKEKQLLRIGQDPKSVKITFSWKESMNEGAGMVFGGNKGKKIEGRKLTWGFYLSPKKKF